MAWKSDKNNQEQNLKDWVGSYYFHCVLKTNQTSFCLLWCQQIRQTKTLPEPRAGEEQCDWILILI